MHERIHLYTNSSSLPIHQEITFEGVSVPGTSVTERLPPTSEDSHEHLVTSESLKNESYVKVTSVQRHITKNVLFISVAFTVLYSAFFSMANLQSSINIDKGLGTVSLATIYMSIIGSSLFLPSFIIRRLTVKWTMCLSMLGFSFYNVAQFYPKFYTMIPAGVMLGLCSAPMWISQSTYLSQVANVFSTMNNDNVEHITIRFFGIFFLFFETTQVWGNLASSLVLSDAKYKIVAENVSHLPICGINFCLKTTSNSSKIQFVKLRSEDLYTLCGIYVVCAIAASIIVAINVEPLTKYGEKEKTGSNSRLTERQLFVATFMHMKHPYTILLIPLTLWNGLEQGFIIATYTQAFVSCAYGLHHVGFVMMAYGVTASTFSLSLSTITEITGRLPVISCGFFVNIITLIVLERWDPNPANPLMFYLVVTLWGVAHAVWQTQLNALYAVLFPNNKEVAFSNYRVFEATGFTVAYICNPYICVWKELYIMTGFLVAGIMGYYTIEWLEHRDKTCTRAGASVSVIN